ncbi:hypothetical protein Sme01_29560 [Sphaerisporangium melleum]|uniref:Uncharacterized protein n=1 Tax=Sphaerisporangium melleum TaxID=321316 RepID=A0A917VHZ6_9ACTN|nr:hypothetical protein [Sphaerisporangium melleum]GGK84984.1 hypothetical protein GCM10007964_29340 [Sphaerisporangium melleum]GII70480.1 hypothetical protein Sme01_29560 [Sphaerisporangium melleum]
MSDPRDSFDENTAADSAGSPETVKIEIRRLDQLETTGLISNPSGS